MTWADSEFRKLAQESYTIYVYTTFTDGVRLLYRNYGINKVEPLWKGQGSLT